MNMLPEGIGNTLHLIAAVIWIGGLALLVLGMRPTLKIAVTDEAERDRLASAVHARFWKLAIVSSAVLLVSGFMMMTADEHFEGFGVYASSWSRFLFAKHALFVVMIAVLVAMKKSRPAKAERDLVDISLMLGLAVLAVTGLLTALD